MLPERALFMPEIEGYHHIIHERLRSSDIIWRQLEMGGGIS